LGDLIILLVAYFKLFIYPIIPFQNQNVGYPTSKNDVKSEPKMGGLTLWKGLLKKA